MTWEQAVVGLLMLFGLIKNSVAAIKDKSLTSGEATGAIFIVLAIYAGYAAVLHSGGFW